MPLKFENLKKESLENTAENIFEKIYYGCIKAKKTVPYRKTALLR